MIRFQRALNAWRTPAFEEVVKREIENVDAKLLPLQQGLSHSSYASEESFSVVVLGFTGSGASIRVKAAIFYTGLIPGCSCADDPTPEEAYPESCEVLFDIDTTTAETTVTLLSS